jgi:S-adenosylmethionine:tRNA ribosyltransferase-isomerase
VELADFSYDLPVELIAQHPPSERGRSRLLVLDRATGAYADRRFVDLPALLRPGDLLVVNDTRVFGARLIGRRLPGGGAAECLLLRRLGDHTPAAGGHLGPRASGPSSRDEVWEALVHPGQRLKEGSRLEFRGGGHLLHAEVLARRFQGRRLVRLWTDGSQLEEAIDALGHVPLPPYIRRPDTPEDRVRYQTVFARVRGSIAAPTAGLHFTPAILDALAAKGVERATITLHAGYGTFQPIRTALVEQHRMDAEPFEVLAPAADALSRALAEGRRIIAVGTTTVRALESLEGAGGRVLPGAGWTELFIVPGHRFRVVSGLVTNFHLPRSSLLLLACAFAGRDRLLGAYRHAVAERYRFYSYGDAMLIL